MSDVTGSSPEHHEADVFSRACASRLAFQQLAGRWGALVVVALGESEGAMRFGALRRRVDGISDRMLSQTLGQLERDGLVERAVHSSIPPNVDYSLTSLGIKVAAPLAALTGIVEEELSTVLAARKRYDEAGAGRS